MCSLGVAPAGLLSGHQQALLSLIANVTQHMRIGLTIKGQEILTTDKAGEWGT